jgi:hypothetical protein
MGKNLRQTKKKTIKQKHNPNKGIVFMASLQATIERAKTKLHLPPFTARSEILHRKTTVF